MREIDWRGADSRVRATTLLNLPHRATGDRTFE